MEKQKRRKYFEINIPYTNYEVRLPREIKLPLLLYVAIFVLLVVNFIAALYRVCS